jgi:AraC family transcriptional regulator, ethanolamine operon transcriptional activator
MAGALINRPWPVSCYTGRRDDCHRDWIIEMLTSVDRSTVTERLPMIGVGPRAAARARRRQLVEQAEDVFLSDAGESISIPALSTTLGVSGRYLRVAFHEVRGMSPKKCALRLRLNEVRRALRHPPSPHVTVTSVAVDRGFFELGRFAVRYKALFGESPSTTLRG